MKLRKKHKQPDQKGQRFIKNCALFGGITIFLAVYFTINSLWSIGTIIVVVLMLLLGGLQLWIFYEFFYKDIDKQ